MELARELGPFYVETESHGAEAITIPTSGTFIQHGGSIIKDALKEVDGLQAMSLDVFVIEDPFGIGFMESSIARRWWEKLDMDVLSKEMDNTLCRSRQFICSVTS